MRKRARRGRPARQAQILETAARIFCEKGFDKASMGDIADAMRLYVVAVPWNVNLAISGRMTGKLNDSRLTSATRSMFARRSGVCQV